MACTSGCPTQDHASYGECLRSKAPHIAYCNSAAGKDYTKQKQWDSELDAYKAAKDQGIQPEGTRRDQIDAAVEISNHFGRAYQADTVSFK